MCVAEAAELQAWRQAFGLTAQATDGSRNRQQEGIVAHGGRMREPTTDPVESRVSVCPQDFLRVNGGLQPSFGVVGRGRSRCCVQ